MKPDERLLSAKELAFRLSRHPSYVYAAVRKGLPSVAGRYRPDQALRWLARHPRPWARPSGR